MNEIKSESVTVQRSYTLHRKIDEILHEQADKLGLSLVTILEISILEFSKRREKHTADTLKPFLTFLKSLN